MMQSRKLDPFFDPFGEPVAMAESRAPAPSSRWLTRTGTGLFWSLVIVIVLARAVYFEPIYFEARVVNGLDHMVAFAQALLASL